MASLFYKASQTLRASQRPNIRRPRYYNDYAEMNALDHVEGSLEDYLFERVEKNDTGHEESDTPNMTISIHLNGEPPAQDTHSSGGHATLLKKGIACIETTSEDILTCRRKLPVTFTVSENFHVGSDLLVIVCCKGIIFLSVDAATDENGLFEWLDDVRQTIRREVRWFDCVGTSLHRDLVCYICTPLDRVGYTQGTDGGTTTFSVRKGFFASLQSALLEYLIIKKVIEWDSTCTEVYTPSCRERVVQIYTKKESSASPRTADSAQPVDSQ